MELINSLKEKNFDKFADKDNGIHDSVLSKYNFSFLYFETSSMYKTDEEKTSPYYDARDGFIFDFIEELDLCRIIHIADIDFGQPIYDESIFAFNNNEYQLEFFINDHFLKKSAGFYHLLMNINMDFIVFYSSINEFVQFASDAETIAKMKEKYKDYILEFDQG